jgi:hypothetical protein
METDELKAFHFSVVNTNSIWKGVSLSFYARAREYRSEIEKTSHCK